MNFPFNFSLSTLRSGKLAPGCMLLIAVGVMILVSSVVIILVGNAQFKEIRTFTEASPQWTEVVQAQGQEKELLDKRIRSFIKALDNAEEVSILLTPRELAQAIALYESMELNRSAITPTEVIQTTEGKHLLRSQICFELNSTFPWQDKPYLNGTLDMDVSTSQEQGGPRIQIISINSSKGEVPQQVIDSMNQMDPFLGGLRDGISEPRGSAALEMIQFVEIAPEGVILATSEEAARKMKQAPISESLESSESTAEDAAR